MMSPCEPQLLSAFLDGELPPATRIAVEQHLAECPSCSTELERLREASNLIQNFSFDSLSAERLSQIHQAIIDEKSQQPIWRIGMMLSALAASVLIISSAWLMEIPPATISIPQGIAAAPMPQWERMAITLRADPLPVQIDEDHSIQFADAKFAQWMLDGLKN